MLKSLQVGVRTNPPDWFQLCLKELNTCNTKKDDLSLVGEGVNTHPPLLHSRIDFYLIFNIADLQISKVQQVQQKIWRGTIIG